MSVIERSAQTNDGRRVRARWSAPLEPWEVWFEDAPEVVARAQTVSLAVRRLFGLPDKGPRWVNGAREVSAALVDRPILTPVGPRMACPCCGFLTLMKSPNGSHEICPVCWWECDAVQLEDPDYRGGANWPSLREARRTYRAVGISRVSHPPGNRHPRQPMPAEYPEARWGEIPPTYLSALVRAGPAEPDTSEADWPAGDRPWHDRQAATPDGRQVRAVQVTPVSAWTVEVIGEADSVCHSRWLLATVRRSLGLDPADWPRWIFRLVEDLCGYQTTLGLRFACPCCDHLTLPAAPTATNAACHVCGWKDEPEQYLDIDAIHPYHKPQTDPYLRPTLRQARANYKTHGESFPEALRAGRYYSGGYDLRLAPPVPEELPPAR